jgi:pimeloyl-ACP methyl ester carboxylesterase
MDMQQLTSTTWMDPNWYQHAFEYMNDAWQRSILFTDIMRKRGNQYLAHIDAGRPPVLVFPYKVVVDGKTLPNPVNYDLVRILDRRPEDRREYEEGDIDKRPIVVIDPRAGHGPGIGGSKLDSQIGVALNAGHPVYFVMFHPNPEPGQTLAHVQQAEVKFLEVIIERHPNTDKPAIIGNCQAGWATALIGADRPDLTGPMVFNGSPLSYWGGVEGANPMRYRGGLYGGVWLTSLWSDIGNGRFDGAHLVSNFEDLNPANTLWAKQYNVYANVDTEEQRFLNFEKWWGGFFKMNREEIHFIVDSLFVGNELQEGLLELEEGHYINLKNFKDPIVVFASQGDNITPPQQALNWITEVYDTTDEIKRNGQVIIYMVHQKIGHLGIFVGSKIARKEHTEIIDTVDMIEYLSPGLYEMVITDEPSKPWLNDHKVKFVERDMEDIQKLDDGIADEAVFRPVAAISKFNDKCYLTFVSPWVRMFINEDLAETIRQMHPLRSQRYMLSDWNPLMWPVKAMAPSIKQFRQTVDPENPFMQCEKMMSDGIIRALDAYRDWRDNTQEFIFNSLYDNSWTNTLFPEPKSPVPPPEPEHQPTRKEIERQLWVQTMQKGGFQEAVVRIITAVSGINRMIDKRQYQAARRIIDTNERLKKIEHSDYKRMVKDQAAFLSYDQDEAIKSLIKLLPRKDDRIEAFEIANSIATADMKLDSAEEALLDNIKKTLKI